jgi:hypothetical protein
MLVNPLLGIGVEGWKNVPSLSTWSYTDVNLVQAYKNNHFLKVSRDRLGIEPGIF